MKTLFMSMDSVLGDTYFFELKGDYSKFSGVFINHYMVEDPIQKELNYILTKTPIKKLKHPTKDWKVFVRCGRL